MLMMFAGVVVFGSGFVFFEGGLTEVSTTIAQLNPHFITLTNPILCICTQLLLFWRNINRIRLAGQPQLLTKILALKDPRI